MRKTDEDKKKEAFPLDKRRVTIYIGHRPYTFYSTDSDEYLRRLEEKANQVLSTTASITHAGPQASAVLSVVSLADELLRQEIAAQAKVQEAPQANAQAETKKAPPKREQKKKTNRSDNENQLTIWDIT